jgi:hypothetical protein
VKQHAVFGSSELRLQVRVPIHARQQSRIKSVDKETNTTFTTNAELSPSPKEQIQYSHCWKRKRNFHFSMKMNIAHGTTATAKNRFSTSQISSFFN